MENRPTFHSTDGLYFRREDNGSVTIIKRATSKDDAPIIFEQNIDDGTWCSVVLSMTGFSERSGDWPRFIKHHMGEKDMFGGM